MELCLLLRPDSSCQLMSAFGEQQTALHSARYCVTGPWQATASMRTLA